MLFRYLFLLLFLLNFKVFALVEVDITRGNLNPLPVTCSPLSMDDNSICSGCVVHEEKMNLDWDEREIKFKELLLSYKSDNNYDCIIPVSGGKDSITQVSYVLNEGLRILCVNIDYGIKTNILFNKKK